MTTGSATMQESDSEQEPKALSGPSLVFESRWEPESPRRVQMAPAGRELAMRQDAKKDCFDRTLRESQPQR